jgi:hypothetical protein
MLKLHQAKLIDIKLLKPHADNYRSHGADQKEHIRSSAQTNGVYKNIVVAKDYTILAGHGVYEVCLEEGAKEVPVVQLDIEPNSPVALKILTGDNEISRLGQVDDRKLSEILKGVSESVEGLLGTGFDPAMLANLVFVTRNADEILNQDAAAEWVGLPEYDQKDETKNKNPIIEIEFENNEDRDKFVEQTQLKIKSKKGDRKWATNWPFIARQDTISVRFKEVETNE